VEGLFDFLYVDPNPFNLTKNIIASGWKTTLRSVEILQPNKSDAVSYPDHSARPPSLWAHAVVVEMAQQQVRAAEYVVGPLTTSSHHPFRYRGSRHKTRRSISEKSRTTNPRFRKTKSYTSTSATAMYPLPKVSLTR
jgi:hypothetical protein